MKVPERSSKTRTWCGPYALAVVAGTDYDSMFAHCKKLLKRPRLAGMYSYQLERVAKSIGIKHFEWEKVNKLTLRAVMDYLIPNRIYIVQLTTHYVVVDTSRWLVVDNQTAEWMEVSNFRYKKARVVYTAEIFRVKKEQNNVECA